MKSRIIFLLIGVISISSVDVFAERKIRFQDPQPKLEIIDDASERAEHIPSKPTDVEGVIKLIESKMKIIIEETLQDTQVMNMLEITNLMTKTKGKEFVQNTTEIFTDFKWKINQTSIKTISDNEKYLLMILTPEREDIPMKIIEFHIVSNKVQDFTFY